MSFFWASLRGRRRRRPFISRVGAVASRALSLSASAWLGPSNPLHWGQTATESQLDSVHTKNDRSVTLEAATRTREGWSQCGQRGRSGD